MRGTLHLIAARYVAARSAHESRNWLKYFTYYGITPAQYEAVIAAVPQVLGSELMTRPVSAGIWPGDTGRLRPLVGDRRRPGQKALPVDRGRTGTRARSRAGTRRSVQEPGLSSPGVDFRRCAG